MLTRSKHPSTRHIVYPTQYQTQIQESWGLKHMVILEPSVVQSKSCWSFYFRASGEDAQKRRMITTEEVGWLEKGEVLGIGQF